MLRDVHRSPQIFHVLLVGTDEETGRRIRNQLSHSFYRITTCATFNEAVGFFITERFDVDLVLSSLEDEDGYNFISGIQLMRENIPHVVIFGAERIVHHEVTRAYKLGACYVLRKPLSEKSDEIENLWKHAFRWRAQNEDLWRRVYRWRVQKGSSSLLPSQQESLEEPSRKQRMVWSEKLNSLFVEVVNGEKDAGPKRILEVMNEREPGLSLTREQVGSHLQKHRENEKKKQLPQPRMNNANGRNVMTVNPITPKFHITNQARPLGSSPSRRDMSHLHLPEASTSNSPVPQMQCCHYNQQQSVYQPMQLSNFRAVPSLIQNGSSNLIPEHQPDSHVNTTRPAMESNLMQQEQNPSSVSENINQDQTLGTPFRRSNMQQQITQNLTSSTQLPDHI